MAYLSSTKNTSTNKRSSFSFSHTLAAGSNRAVFIGIITVADVAAVGPSSVAYGGNTATQVAQVSGSPDNNRYMTVTVYKLANPPTGANTCSGSYANSSQAVWADGVVIWDADDTDQTDPVGVAAVTATGTNNNARASLTTNEDDQVVFCFAGHFGGDTPAFTPHNCTERVDSTTGDTQPSNDGGFFLGDKVQATQGSVTLGCDAQVNDDWYIIAFGAKNAPGSVTPQADVTQRLAAASQAATATRQISSFPPAYSKHTFDSNLLPRSSFSFSHTLGAGSDKGLQVLIGIITDANLEAASSVTYGGTALSLVQREQTPAGNNRYLNAEVWSWDSASTISTGTSTVAGSFSNSGSHGIWADVVVAVDESGVDQVTPITSSASEAEDLDVTDDAVVGLTTTEANQLVVAWGIARGADMSPNDAVVGGLTERADGESGGGKEFNDLAYFLGDVEQVMPDTLAVGFDLPAREGWCVIAYALANAEIRFVADIDQNLAAVSQAATATQAFGNPKARVSQVLAATSQAATATRNIMTPAGDITQSLAAVSQSVEAWRVMPNPAGNITQVLAALSQVATATYVFPNPNAPDNTDEELASRSVWAYQVEYPTGLGTPPSNTPPTSGSTSGNTLTTNTGTAIDDQAGSQLETS